MGKILRRTFLVGTAAIAGGVAFGTWAVAREYPNPLDDLAKPGERVFNPWLTITDDGTVTVMIPRAEMGQGISTTLAALVAEELEVPLDAVRIAAAPASHAYYNSAMLEDGAPLAHFNRSLTAEATRAVAGAMGKVLGLQVTGGSSSLKDAWTRMREAGATARETLRLAAAERLGVDASAVRMREGFAMVGEGAGEGAAERRVPYGELAEAAARIDPPAVELKPREDWSILGRSQPRVDMVPKVTGAPIYGMDVDDDVIAATLGERVEPMLTAAPVMNPRLGAKLAGPVPDRPNLPGVLAVVDVSAVPGQANEGEPYGGGVAVVATNTWAAFRGAEALDVAWGEAAYPPDTPAVMRAIEASLDAAMDGDGGDGGDGMRDDGDVAAAFGGAPDAEVIEATYRVPYLAHMCMEPMNATVLVRDLPGDEGGRRVDVWAGTQMPTLVRADVAAETGADEGNVHVHSMYLGGGFGRRGELDFTRFAARVAKQMPGRPVKLAWSREEDTRHDTYRPAAVGRFRARLREGRVAAVDMRIACPSVMKSALSRAFPSISPVGPDNSITQGAFDQPYTTSSFYESDDMPTGWRVSGTKAPVDIPIGFWRSVGNSYNGFFHEGFMDEIARATGRDPLALRRELMRPWPTALGVVERAAAMADWGAPKAEGVGKGLAFTLSFGTWTAQVVQVTVRARPDGRRQVRVDDVWCAADLGTVVDPAIVKAQLSSGIVYGLSAAMDEQITFRDGAVEQSNFHDVAPMRIHQCPRIHVELLQAAEHMGGAGEPGTPPAAPALANAIFDATGERVRELPLTKAGFVFG